MLKVTTRFDPRGTYLESELNLVPIGTMKCDKY